MATPVIHYTFDTDGTNSGSLGSTYDLTIPSGYSINETAKLIGTKGLMAGNNSSGTIFDSAIHKTEMANDWTTTDNFSISFWANPINGFHSMGHVVLAFSIDTLANNTQLYFNNSSNLSFWGNNQIWTPTVPSQFDGNWHHYVMTFALNGDVSLYVDNVSYGTTNFTTFSNKQMVTLTMGGDADVGTRHILNGYIDDFRIYDYLLDVAKINIIYLFGTGTTLADLIAAGVVSIADLLAEYTIPQLHKEGVIPDWTLDTDANHFAQSYVKDFLDISGSLVLRENSSLTVNGNIETKGNITVKNPIMTVDLSLNHNMFVIGDVSMNSNVTVGDVSMNGKVVDCSFTDRTIPENTFNGTLPSPDYTQPMIMYEKGFETSYDVSMNGQVQINKLKIDGNLGLSDGTTMNTYDDNKESNGTTFKTSTFTSLTINNTLTAGTFSTSSDYRIKTDISQLDEKVTLDNLRPVKFLQTIINKPQYGLIAHELQEYYPDLVVGEKDGEKWQRVNYTGLVALLINEIKQLKRELTELENGM